MPERGRLGTFALLVALLFVTSSARAGAAVRAWLDTNQVAPGGSVQLTLEYEGDTRSDPDLAPLQRDFDVLGTSRATTVQILNGSTSSKTQVMVTLSPKHAGQLTIPSIAWNGERTSPLSLDVTASAGHAAPGAGAAPSRRVFIETQFKPSNPYVEAAVEVTVRVYTRVALYDPNITLSGGGDFVVRQIGSGEEGTAMHGGESYAVVTRRYDVFPLRSGRLTLDGPELDARIVSRARSSFPGNPFGGFFGSGSLFGSVFSSVTPVRLRGDAIHLDVRSRPPGAVGSYWLPATAVTLKSTWHPATLKAEAGNPITVDLSVAAKGLTAAQLPDLSQLLSHPAGLKAYPDQPKLSDSARGATVVGTREQSIAFIADRPGDYTLPALTLHWWNTQDDRPSIASLPLQTLIVVPAPGSIAPPPPRPAVQVSQPAAGAALSARASSGPTARAEPRNRSAGAPSERGLLTGRLPWIAAIAALALAWLATLIAWWRLRRHAARRKPPAPAPAVETAAVVRRASAVRSAFRRACELDDARGARRHLLAWIAAAWPDDPPRGLNALAREIGDPALGALIRELDRACYAGEPWSGEPLGAALAELPERAAKRDRSRSEDLASLYP